jgi:hypothetical protein
MSNEKRRLFQYAAILHQTEVKDGKEVYTGAELLIPLTTALAVNDKEILFKVIRQIPEDKSAEPDKVEIIIKGF